MLENGKNTQKFFTKTNNVYQLKTLEAFAAVTSILLFLDQKEYKKEEKPSKKYFQGEALSEIVMSYPMRKKNLGPEDVQKEIESRRSFVDFVSGSQ